MLSAGRMLALLLPRCLLGGGGGGMFSELMKLARVIVDVVRLRALRGMIGFERSGPSVSGSVSSDVDGKLDRVVVSLNLCDVRREGGGGGALEGWDNEDELESGCEMEVKDCSDGLLLDSGGLLGP